MINRAIIRKEYNAKMGDCRVYTCSKYPIAVKSIPAIKIQINVK
jgi:hypothetical protein